MTNNGCQKIPGLHRPCSNRATPCEARAEENCAAPKVALDAPEPRLRQPIDARDYRVREAGHIGCGKIQRRSERPQLPADGRVCREDIGAGWTSRQMVRDLLHLVGLEFGILERTEHQAYFTTFGHIPLQPPQLPARS